MFYYIDTDKTGKASVIKVDNGIKRRCKGTIFRSGATTDRQAGVNSKRHV